MILFDVLHPITSNFIFVPVIYLFVNIMMITTELPLLLKLNMVMDEKSLDQTMNSLGLSAREREVALRLIRGTTYQKIADELFISLQTVKTHANRIYTKTGTGNKLELREKVKTELRNIEGDKTS
jgi:DNA-binding CsgD family transcriptional regulator